MTADTGPNFSYTKSSGIAAISKRSGTNLGGQGIAALFLVQTLKDKELTGQRQQPAYGAVDQGMYNNFQL